jgi:hypothetical protein
MITARSKISRLGMIGVTFTREQDSGHADSYRNEVCESVC